MRTASKLVFMGSALAIPAAAIADRATGGVIVESAPKKNRK